MGDEAFALSEEYIDFYVEQKMRERAYHNREPYHRINVGRLCSDDYGCRRRRKKKHKSNGGGRNNLIQHKKRTTEQPTKEERKTMAISKYNNAYTINKNAKVGETITCPICGETFIKKQYSQAFCSLKCKNTYWNKTKGDRHKK